MRKQSETLYMDYEYSMLLRSIAKAYNMTISQFLSAIAVKAIRDETVSLKLPVQKILGKSTFDSFARTIEDDYFIDLQFGSKNCKETEEQFNRFSNYILQGKVNNIQPQTPTPNPLPPTESVQSFHQPTQYTDAQQVQRPASPEPLTGVDIVYMNDISTENNEQKTKQESASPAKKSHVASL